VAEQFDGPVGVDGNLDVAGNVEIGGQNQPVRVLHIAGHMHADGACDAGIANFRDMSVDFDLKVGRGLLVRGPVRPEPAAQFGSHVGVDGNLDVAGDISLLNADCAEDFDVAADCEDLIVPGVVVVLGPEGSLRHSTSAYDKRVAGVVACAGGLKSAIILDRRSDGSRRVPVALMGKVACNVDADYGSVDVGDLLTTSDTPGHAMRASDPMRAFGAVIGKALGTLGRGRGLVPVLVALQ
jgi:hypothetical protein